MFLTFVLATLGGGWAFGVMKRWFGWHALPEQVLTQTPWIITLQMVWELLWLLFIYFTVSKKYHRRFWEALKWVPTPRPGVTYVVIGAALSLAAQLVVNLFPTDKHLPVEKLFTSPSDAYLLAFFGICVAPFVEEMVFRGFFYPVFERLWGLSSAVLLTALLFAAIHVPQLIGGWEEIASILVVGAVFSYCRGKTGSLVAPFLMHVAYNASLFVSLYVTTDQFRALKG